MNGELDRRDKFETIATEVLLPLRRYLRRRLDADSADEVLAETMLTIWRRLDSAPPEGAIPWSFGIARNLVSNRRRALRRQQRLIDRLKSEPRQDHVPDHSESGPDPELQAALEQLDEDDRELLRLWAWEQLEPRELALVLGLGVNAVSKRLSRARLRLGRLLESQNHSHAGHEVFEGTQERL